MRKDSLHKVQFSGYTNVACVRYRRSNSLSMISFSVWLFFFPLALNSANRMEWAKTEKPTKWTEQQQQRQNHRCTDPDSMDENLTKYDTANTLDYKHIYEK